MTGCWCIFLSFTVLYYVWLTWKREGSGWYFMTQKDYDALKVILEEFRQEKGSIDIRFQNNVRRIKEAQVYLKTLMGSEPDDFKVFSPRKPEVIHKEEIGKIRGEISELEGQNQEFGDRKLVLTKHIRNLEDILGREHVDSQEEEENAEKLKEESLRGLADLVRRMEQSSACIEKNPIQAKQECVIIARCIQDIVDKMKDSVRRC